MRFLEEMHSKTNATADTSVQKTALHSRLVALRIIFSLSLLLFLLGALPTPAEAAVYDGIFRLHVIASGDTEAEQALKLSVRDGILPLICELTAGSKDPQTAAEVLSAHKEEIENAATSVLRRAGNSDAVRVEVGPAVYDRRQLGDCTFPAGEYLSMRVIIGEGKGQNWWGILFPETALYLSSDLPPSALFDFSAAETNLLRGGECELRFRTLELLSCLFGQ